MHGFGNVYKGVIDNVAATCTMSSFCSSRSAYSYFQQRSYFVTKKIDPTRKEARIPDGREFIEGLERKLPETRLVYVVFRCRQPSIYNTWI